MDDEPVLAVLVRNADSVESYPQGAVVFREGDKGEYMYAVRKGRVELSTGGQAVEVVEFGGIFGEMVLVGRSERSATAVALEECQLVPIDQKHFDRLIQLNAFLAREIMRVMAERLKAMNERLKSVS